MSNLLRGQLAFITGAGGGIGRAVCRALAKEGADIIAADENIRTAKETISDLTSSNHLPIQIDVSNAASVDDALKKVVGHFSRAPTIVVNAAGITRDNFLLKLPVEDFEKVIDVNLKGTFLVTKACVNSMIEGNVSRGGSVVNIASIVGKTGNIGQSNYCASKAGVEAFTKTASMEFGKFGVRVNAVLPGIIETAMIETIPSEVKQMFKSKIALGRMGKPEEVAELVLFLASPQSSYINGASVEITGGMH
ncbi:estradiol 17-beta-dehydrogenase 8 [Diachasma alloeum]|uniref:estradiol 17-beta-dehydrogenase 8 n=1 Tax=Diachasma alloeum TaxID=454923 RepID=UPI0007381F7A|nr:estradiol 17-beta-dehydrogenase 8 [Diachasma alloeum]